MIRNAILITLLFSCLAVEGQDNGKDHLLFNTALEQEAFRYPDCKKDTLLFLMVYDSTLDSNKYQEIQNSLNLFVRQLERRKSKFKTDANFIGFVFRKTHRKYLGSYVRYGAFNELFYTRNYNCLSGTALYAYILGQLGFEVRIAETKVHSFLTILQKGKVEFLIEATDPYNGFVKREGKVLERIQEYQKKESAIASDSIAISVQRYLPITQIQLKELAGLHYFNLAVVDFNNSNYSESLICLRKAEILYPDSQRIKDLIQFINTQSGSRERIEGYYMSKKLNKQTPNLKQK